MLSEVRLGGTRRNGRDESEKSREYERSLSAVKSGVNPGWSREADTTQSRTVGGGTPAAGNEARAAWRRCEPWHSPWRERADTGQRNLPPSSKRQRCCGAPWSDSLAGIVNEVSRNLNQSGGKFIDSQPPRSCGVAVLAALGLNQDQLSGMESRKPYFGSAPVSLAQ